MLRIAALAIAALTLLACDGNVNGGTDGLPISSTLPTYSGGSCPTLVSGENDLVSGGETRRFVLFVNGDARGAPVVFAWHGLGGSPYDVLLGTGLASLSDVVVIAPFAAGRLPFAWDSTSPESGNIDLRLFDDMLACLDAQFGVDRERVWTTGVSAGALWSAYLLQYRSEFLAAAALLSGGQPDPSLAPPYKTPARDLPVLLAWGGDSDVFRIAGQSFVFNNGDPETFSFAVASRVLSAHLRDDGHFVVHCIGDYGHFERLPPDPFSLVWPFLRDHPRDLGSEPWANGVPADASPLCALP